MNEINAAFERNLLTIDGSLRKAFINSHFRNTVPMILNEKNILNCFEILNENVESCSINKIFSLFKPLFVSIEWLSIQRMIDLFDFFYFYSFKQFELFRNKDFNIEM